MGGEGGGGGGRGFGRGPPPGGYGDRGGPPRGQPSGSEEPPEVGSIHHATVVSVRPFGAFVELPGFRKQGLVHHSQVSLVGMACCAGKSVKETMKEIVEVEKKGMQKKTERKAESGWPS